MPREFLTIEQLSEKVRLPVPTLNTLRLNKKIPFLALGYRTLRFEYDKVVAALDRLEVKSAS